MQTNRELNLMINNNIDSISLEALKTGDHYAFAQLVDATSGKIYHMVFQMLGNAQDAEDVLQETYVKAFRSLADFEGRSSLKTWLYRIAVNEALMLMRRRNPRVVSMDETPATDDNEVDTMEIVDWCCLPEGELLSEEARRFLERVVQQLPENLRVVFIMRDLEGLSVAETAEALGISEGNVKTRLLRARLRLRQDLSFYFGSRLQQEDLRR
ncbi:MAG: sigma-70 family RNA polymerase sigma factor [Anaerolineae bacterium]|nr:sigma-70 family RNA polymerase sigma factor [Anaerolineae bacterium]